MVLALASLLYFAQDVLLFKDKSQCEADNKSHWQPFNARASWGICWTQAGGAPLEFLAALAAAAALIGAGAAVMFFAPNGNVVSRPEPQTFKLVQTSDRS